MVMMRRNLSLAPAVFALAGAPALRHAGAREQEIDPGRRRRDVSRARRAGGEASGVGIAFGVSTRSAVAPGDFQCGPAAGGYPITSFSYTATGVEALYQSCTVRIPALGAAKGEHATGTFSAVLNKTGGGTKAITAGAFDVPLTVSP